MSDRCAAQYRLARLKTLVRTHLVKSFVEFFELSSLSHHSLVHEEWWLNLLEPLRSEVIETIRNHGLVEVDTISGEVESTVTSNLGTCQSRNVAESASVKYTGFGMREID